ncbi:MULTISPECIES: OmpA family protein [unclassified Rathayibacter]|uniref:OmpA family protein n=1 Tax=unclassified Rathayibacter TaxID=2609250 RepID=UPI0006F37390|nr:MULTISPECIES: OmpA family protein [unclassified Rathayibacter]KQQ06280.1 hypothetical protein ASF42_07155 [Rathayibacter sp. Leaf294]KQS14135.1 hypothetical protein ASG06_07155 [Rathayibacter sp. Leaf185]
MPTPRPRRPALNASFLTLLLLGASLAGCSASAESTSAAGDEGAGPVSVTELAEAQRAGCAEVLGGPVVESEPQGPVVGETVVVVDRSASHVLTTMPDELSEQIREASRQGGTITLVAVDGEDVEPRILLKDSPLSTPGERDRPSVGSLAASMPSCIADVIARESAPTARGSDLHRALALAKELAGASATMWLVSDLVSTTGAFALDDRMLASSVEEASGRIASVASLDLGGAPLHMLGIGNTSTALRSGDREWLRDLGRRLCAAWNASECDAIVVDPVNAEAPDASLPEDPLPGFPAVATSALPGGDCEFTVPANLAFSEDSPVPREDAAVALAAPLALAVDSAGATVQITGHAASSATWTQEALVTLSEDRADAVAGLFEAAGVPADRVMARGVGDSEPLAEDIDAATGEQIPDRAAAERRVDIVVAGVGEGGCGP